MIQGGQIIAKNSIQGRKASLLFICKLLTYYNDINALNMVLMHSFRWTVAAIVSSINFYKSVEIFLDQYHCAGIDDTYLYLYAMLSRLSNNIFYSVTLMI